MPPSHRSILPSVPGVPAGAAVLIAVTCTFIGFLIDAQGGDDLTGSFATAYVVGCVLAVLAVRYRGLFTAMVLPPLLMFVAVPISYQVLLGSSASFKIKDLLLNLAVPLVNRFPTMALATVVVLIIGAIRIALHRREAKAGTDGEPTGTRARATRPNSARGQRTRSADAKDPARRFSRGTADASTTADSVGTDTAARTGRRAAATRVAADPPRVGSTRQPRTGAQPAARAGAAERAPAAGEGRRRRAQSPEQAAERTRTGERRAVPADSPADRTRTAERRAVPPQDRTRTGERRAAPADRTRAPQPAAEPTEGRRRRAQTPEPPPARGSERHAAPERQPGTNPVPGEAGGRRRRAQPGDIPPHPRPNVRYRERDSGRIER